MPLKIEEYALIGDCHTAALVGNDGSIDWLCLPRFDSPACFAALLGTPEHGRWKICPKGKNHRVTRRYRDDTLILETDFENAEGEVRLIDFMPLRSVTPDLVRIVEGRRGRVKIDVELILRFDYGSIAPWVRRTSRGIRAIAGPDTVHCRTNVEMRGEDLRTIAEFSINAGERVDFVLAWRPTYGPEPEEREPERMLRDTEKWWRQWSARCEYKGEWRDAVLRSLITIKAMTYAPTGGIVASPTT